MCMKGDQGSGNGALFRSAGQNQRTKDSGTSVLTKGTNISIGDTPNLIISHELYRALPSEEKFKPSTSIRAFCNTLCAELPEASSL